MSQKWKLAVVAVVVGLLSVLLPLVLLVSLVTNLIGGSSCGAPGGAGAAVDPAAFGSAPEWTTEQLTNAALIRQAALDAGMGELAALRGINAAIGESTLISVNFGDKVGPDSRGLFQQRDPWGPLAARLDPYQAATMFFTGGQGGQPGLNSVTGWEALSATEAIHRVQRNADPNHYAKFEAQADEVYAAVSGLDPGQIPTGGCSPGGTATLAAGPDGWVTPAVGPKTSGFGPRGGQPHNGIDIAPPKGDPIYAAAAGTVAGICTGNHSPCTGYGSLITIDHGGGVVTRYAHMAAGDILVTLGQPVTAGQQIARVGNEGQSTGPHLHFEVQINGAFTDPAPFLAQRNVALAG